MPRTSTVQIQFWVLKEMKNTGRTRRTEISDNKGQNQGEVTAIPLLYL